MIIGGNVNAIFQYKTSLKNEIGEQVSDWNDYTQTMGWLDLSSGGSSRNTHKTKTEESTHCFICDYNKAIRDLDITQSRVIINNRIYEIKYIDDPMEVHDHLEVNLKLVGVSNE